MNIYTNIYKHLHIYMCIHICLYIKQTKQLFGLWGETQHQCFFYLLFSSNFSQGLYWFGRRLNICDQLIKLPLKSEEIWLSHPCLLLWDLRNSDSFFPPICLFWIINESLKQPRLFSLFGSKTFTTAASPWHFSILFSTLHALLINLMSNEETNSL